MEENGSGLDGCELDLTNSHLHSLQSVEISPSLTAVDLTANRLKEVDERILALTGLQTFSLRQNLMEDPNAVAESQSKDVLEDLELRDNHFKELPKLAGFPKLRRLEVSYNEIKGMQGIADLGALALHELHLASNKIAKVEGLESHASLQILELGSNRIREIEGIAHIQGLRELWLGRNRITQITNLETLTNLRQLSLQSNRLESMSGLQACVALEELYLSHNGIQKMEGLEALTKLQVLDLGNNGITKLECLDTLRGLQDLWLNENKVDDWKGLYEALEGPRTSLTTVYLHDNGLAKDPMYQRKILQILPNLTQLDANYITQR